MNSKKSKTVKTATVNGTKYRLLSNGELWTVGRHRYMAGYVSDPDNILEAIDAHEEELVYLLEGV